MLTCETELEATPDSQAALHETHLPRMAELKAVDQSGAGRLWMAIELMRLASADVAAKAADRELEAVERAAVQESAALLERVMSGRAGTAPQAFPRQIVRPAQEVVSDTRGGSEDFLVTPSSVKKNESTTSRLRTSLLAEAGTCDTPSSAHSNPKRVKKGNSDLKKKKEETQARGQAVKIFEQCDLDADGFVKRDELYHTLHRVGLEEDDIERIFVKVGANEENKISRSRWMEMWRAGTEDKDLKEKIEIHIQMAAEQHHQRRRFMISETSPFRIFWDVATVGLLSWITISLPFQIAFLPEESSDWPFFFLMEWIVDIWFFVDVFLNFRTTFSNADHFEVWDPVQVAWRYLTGWFLLDVLSSAPLDRLGLTKGTNTSGLKLAKLGKLVRVFKLLRFGRVIQSLERSELGQQAEEILTSGDFQARIALLCILFFMLFVSHLLACLMAMIGGEYLIGYEDVMPNQYYRKYLASMYWAITTVTTVGYGDILPTTDLERTVAMIGMVVGGGFYGYVIGSITDIITARGVKARMYYARMEGIQSWCDHHHFPQQERRRIRRYFDYFLSQSSLPDEASIMNDLTPELRNEVAQYMIKDEVRECYIFDKIPTGVLARIAHIVRSVAAEENDVIINMGEVGCAMFIVERGKVNLVREKADHTVSKIDVEERKFDRKDTMGSHTEIGEKKAEVLERGDCFGEEIILGFFDVYQYEVYALEMVTLHMISEEHFVQALWHAPDMVALMRDNARPFVEEHREVSKKRNLPKGRGSLLGGSASVPHGFADYVIDTLDDVSAKLNHLLHSDVVHASLTPKDKRSEFISLLPYTADCVSV